MKSHGGIVLHETVLEIGKHNWLVDIDDVMDAHLKRGADRKSVV